MKHTSLALIAGLALMACSPSEPPAETASTMTPPASEPAPAPPPSVGTTPPTTVAEDTCNMAQYATLVGKPATDPGVPAASSTVRHIKPDSQVTMDFSPARLNIDINAEGVITGLRCG